MMETPGLIFAAACALLLLFFKKWVDATEEMNKETRRRIETVEKTMGEEYVKEKLCAERRERDDQKD